MKSIADLLKEINTELGINVVTEEGDIKVSQVVLEKLNSYLYQESDGFISEYHKYWKDNHGDILKFKINIEKAKEIALKFDDIFKNPNKYSKLELSPSINRSGLTDEAIANIRFFTAIQDFKINIYKSGKDPFKMYFTNKEWYTATDIVKNNKIINEFLMYLEATGSQGDKREKWMRNAAQFLIDKFDGNAYNIYKRCEEDVLKVREVIADVTEIGYSRKKADMFIRDMFDWNIWTPGKNRDKLNIASDTNTMRVALRSGLLETEIPLLASYLDVYCYQYSLMDNMTQEAWRTVWDEWNKIPNSSSPPAPASMDYLIYKSIGKKCCLKNKRKCNICVMNTICPDNKKNLKSPKSISVMGMTGWESGRTDSGGGGGIMS